MALPERPQLRPYLAAARDEHDPHFIILWDKLGLAVKPLRVRADDFDWLLQLNGRRTLREIQSAAMLRNGGLFLPLESFTEVVKRLEDGLYLDGPRFREKVAGPVREPACIGCYQGQPAALRRQLERLFTDREGPGLPGSPRCDGRLRAALLPHIDYTRGGHTYAWGFKEVFEGTDASLFVIIGTSHYSGHRFTLTRKNFKTPLGTVPTDQAYIDRLVAAYGDGLFDDEICHLPEHSIELEVVFLQWLYEGKRSIRIVPLVVGSFQDCIEDAKAPSSRNDVGRMIAALRQAEAETKESICYLISGDLAHIGPKFGDPEPVAESVLARSRRQDHSLIEQTERADVAGYFRILAEEGDCRRVCGLPPTYTALEAVRPSSGKLLHYDQYVHPVGFESVSFASVAFYR
jgi:AmmeMemoRadiSam system protein B